LRDHHSQQLFRAIHGYFANSSRSVGSISEEIYSQQAVYLSYTYAYAESIFRTCKYRPDYPYKGFATLGDARAWVLQFATWYNQEHKHSGLKFITPAQRHSGQTAEVMQQRQAVYEAAKAANPKRWSGRTRNWDLPEEVWLNPEKEGGSLEVAA